MRSAAARYALAVVSVAAALGVSLLSRRHDDAVALCLAAVVLATWLAGLGPGILTALLATGAVDYALGDFFLGNVAVHAVLFLGSSVIVGWTRDELNERRQSEQELAGQYAIARIISQSTSWLDAAPRLLATIGRITGWEWAALWVAERDGSALRCRETWHDTSLSATDGLDAESRATVVHEDNGLPGRVWSEGAIAVSRDLPPAATAAGLRVAVGVPLRAGRETLGVLEIMTRAEAPTPFDARLTETLSVLGEQIGQFTHRRRVEQDRESLASLVQNSSDFVGIASLDGDWMFINPAGQSLVGLDGDDDVRASPMRTLFVEDVTPAVIEHRYWSGNARVRHARTGVEIPVLLHVFAIVAHNRIVALAVIARDITDLERREADRKRTARALRRARERALTARFTAILDERARVAREIHDSLLQGVTGIALQLRAVLPHVTPSDTLQRIMELADRTSHEARRAIWDLRSTAIVDDLTGALDAAWRRVLAGTSVAYHMTVTGRPRPLAARIVPAAVRVIAEALTNVVKHANARSVWMTVAYERRLVRITIADDGRGFDVDGSREGHWGIVGMQERTGEIGGQLNVRSTIGAGTEVVLDIPVNRRGG